MLKNNNGGSMWRTRAGMTAHYSVAQVKEIHDVLERLTNETHLQNGSLAIIAREARRA